eukprot:UN06058
MGEAIEESNSKATSIVISIVDHRGVFIVKDKELSLSDIKSIASVSNLTSTLSIKPGAYRLINR